MVVCMQFCIAFYFACLLASCPTCLFTFIWHLTYKPQAGFNKSCLYSFPFLLKFPFEVPHCCFCKPFRSFVLASSIENSWLKCTVEQGDAVVINQPALSATGLRVQAAQWRHLRYILIHCQDWIPALVAQILDQPSGNLPDGPDGTVWAWLNLRSLDATRGLHLEAAVRSIQLRLLG